MSLSRNYSKSRQGSTSHFPANGITLRARHALRVIFVFLSFLEYGSPLQWRRLFLLYSAAMAAVSCTGRGLFLLCSASLWFLPGGCESCFAEIGNWCLSTTGARINSSALSALSLWLSVSLKRMLSAFAAVRPLGIVFDTATIVAALDARGKPPTVSTARDDS